jgi:hypothetical protein
MQPAPEEIYFPNGLIKANTVHILKRIDIFSYSYTVTTSLPLNAVPHFLVRSTVKVLITQIPFSKNKH